MKVGFLSLLTLLFIALKLTGVLAWSWLWILSPIWLGFAALIIVIILIVLIASVSKS